MMFSKFNESFMKRAPLIAKMVDTEILNDYMPWSKNIQVTCAK